MKILSKWGYVKNKIMSVILKTIILKKYFRSLDNSKNIVSMIGRMLHLFGKKMIININILEYRLPPVILIIRKGFFVKPMAN